MFAKLALTAATALSLVAAPVTGTALSSTEAPGSSSLATSASTTIAPTSPLYGLVQFWNTLQLAVPMSATARANLEMRIARSDAAAAVQMLSSGHPSLAVGPMNGYTNAMTNARADLGPSPQGMEELNLLATAQAGQEVARMAAQAGLGSHAVAALQAAETHTSNPVAEAAMAHAIARLSGTSTQAILALHARGLTWAQVASREGLKLGVVFNPAASDDANFHATGSSGTPATGGSSTASTGSPASGSGGGSGSASGSLTTSPAGHASANGQSHGAAFTVFGLSL